MCLVVLKGTKGRIAERDIPVYKLMIKTEDFSFVSGYYPKTVWSLGETKAAKIEETIDREFFDSKDKKDNITAARGESLRNSFTFYGPGFHSASSLRRIQYTVRNYWWVKNSNCIIVKCTIPKGSTYYRNVSSLCVSNALTLIGEI
jgi:hypothetical protein